jgi:putative acetyltransferase
VLTRTALSRDDAPVTVQVRFVERTDVATVIDIVRAALEEFGLEFGKGAVTDDELHDLPGAYVEHGGAFWVASIDGALVGTAGVFPVAPGTFELRKMYLRPAARGHGVGTRLLDTAVAWTRAVGGTMMVLDTIEAMVRAIAFYEAHGFVRDDSQRRGARCSRGYARRLG